MTNVMEQNEVKCHTLLTRRKRPTRVHSQPLIWEEILGKLVVNNSTTSRAEIKKQIEKKYKKKSHFKILNFLKKSLN